MSYIAQHRFAQISPRKVRVFADLIRGQYADEALNILSCYPNLGARLLEKVVNSALGNAEDKREGAIKNLIVVDVRVDCGPFSKRFRPKSRGSSTVIKKRTSHLTVELG
ncbi:MAG: 50S ribosomal protein L22 [Thermoguttaceae bacterium]